MKIKTIVFDFDGTLIDSAAGILLALKEALVASQIELTVNIDESIVGQPVREIIEQLNLSYTSVQLDNAVATFRCLYDNGYFKLAKPYMRAKEVLQWLRVNAISIMVATNKPYEPTKYLINELFPNLIDDFITVDGNGEKRFSKVEMLSYLSVKHGLDTQSSLMIGDTAKDIKAGQSLGWYTGAAMWGYGCKQELSSLQPTWYINNIYDILQLIS